MIVVNHSASAQGINPVYIALITGAITAAAAIFGVWLTQRKTVHLAYQQRSDSRKESVRRLVGELVGAARPWGAMLEVQALAMSKMNDLSDLHELTETESAQDSRRHRQTMMRAFLEARMRIADQPLAGCIDAALAQAEYYTYSTQKLAPGRDRATGRELDALRVAMMVQADQFEDSLKKIEAAASGMLREEMDLSLPPLALVRFWRRLVEAFNRRPWRIKRQRQRQ